LRRLLGVPIVDGGLYFVDIETPGSIRRHAACFESLVTEYAAPHQDSLRAAGGPVNPGVEPVQYWMEYAKPVRRR